MFCQFIFKIHRIGFVYAMTKYIRNPSHEVREAALSIFHKMKISDQEVLNRLSLSMEQWTYFPSPEDVQLGIG